MARLGDRGLRHAAIRLTPPSCFPRGLSPLSLQDGARHESYRLDFLPPAGPASTSPSLSSSASSSLSGGRRLDSRPSFFSYLPEYPSSE